MPTLHYADEGRSGRVIYSDHLGDIAFYYEFGGGDCVAIISVPGEAEWTKTTKRPLTERETILRFVAENATRDQTAHGRWQLLENWIEIYSV